MFHSLKAHKPKFQSRFHALLRLLVFLAIIIILITGINYLVRRVLSGVDPDAVFLLRELADFLIFVFASWVMGRVEDRTIGDYGLPWRGAFGRRFWQDMALGFACITVLLAAMRVLGTAHFGGFALRGSEVWKWAAVYGLVFALVALREEFRVRGYGLFTLSYAIGFWPAAILSSAFFGYSHHGNSGEDWIGLFNAGLFGLLACFLLRRTGNLWLPIGVHTAFDWGETYFYGVANSGQTLPGHLLNTSLSGSPWLSGGSVGPEGSVLCTLVLVAAWVGCSIWFPEAKYPCEEAQPLKTASGN